MLVIVLTGRVASHGSVDEAFETWKYELLRDAGEDWLGIWEPLWSARTDVLRAPRRSRKRSRSGCFASSAPTA
jgi:hypothetical protein